MLLNIILLPGEKLDSYERNQFSNNRYIIESKFVFTFNLHSIKKI